MKAPAAIAAVLAAAMLGGCQDPGRVHVPDWPPPPVDQVDGMLVQLKPPAPLNWDDKPGADGFQVQVNLFREGDDLSVTVKGALEFGLYEGQPSPGQLETAKPFHLWRFDNPDLRLHMGKSIMGWGYGMRLPWGPQPPPFATGTLVVRYLSPSSHVGATQSIKVTLGPV